MRNPRQKSREGVYLLLFELLRNDRLPPVTLACIALNVLIYLEYFFDFPSLEAVCLSAASIIYHKQWIRLLFSPFFHGDDWHLYYNMSSFAIKGRSLEKRYGSVYFACLLALFTVCCSSMLVVLEIAANYLLKDQIHLHSCAVGFSGVIFALKVLTTHYLPDGTNYMFGAIPVPNKYVYWAELVVISLITPNASFAGKCLILLN